ncbi:MAG TPA: hypothetical protein VIE68_04945 [Gemmatimonadota bacterium]
MADVSSLVLSDDDIASGGSSIGTVTLSAGSPPNTRVTLASSRPTVATVPSSIIVKAGQAGFKVLSVSGAAGCTEISAKVGFTPSKTKLLFVQPPVSPESTATLTLSRTSVAGGTSLTGTVRATLAGGQSSTVQLSSSNPAVTVPASVQLSPVEGGAFSATFNIGTTVVAPSTCSVITATNSGRQMRALLKVFTISG